MDKPAHITRGNVLDDLGLSRAEVTEAKVKAELWRDLLAHITPLGLTQKELARQLGVHQPEVSHLLAGKLSKFSPGTLIQYAVRMELDVHVTISAPNSASAATPAVEKRGKRSSPRKRTQAVGV